MLPKVTRGTLAEQVTNQLQIYIEQQQLKPGDCLPSETSLAASFGVSRPVIREGLKNLEGKGVIEIINGKGALIRPIDSGSLQLFFKHAMRMDQKTMLELMEIRKGLEVQAAALAAKRRDEKDLKSIRQIVEAMRPNMKNLETYTQLDVELHLHIAAASHNDMMVYLVEAIREALRSSIIAGITSRGTELHLETVQQSHEMLLQTLITMDDAAATLAMVHHFDIAMDAIAHPQA